MLKLPSGETVPFSMPAVVIMPTPTSAVSQSSTTVSSKPVQLLSNGSLIGMISQVTSQSLMPLTLQVPHSTPAGASSGVAAMVTNSSQPEAVFDLPESGLTALGIAASTREVCLHIAAHYTIGLTCWRKCFACLLVNTV